MSASHWLLYQLEAGELSEAAVVVDEMRALMSSRDVSPVVVVNASVTVVWYEATQRAAVLPADGRSRARPDAMTGMFYTSRHVVLSAGLMGALSDADLETARSVASRARRDVHLLGPGFRFWYHSFVVWEALIRGDAAQPPELRARDATAELRQRAPARRSGRASPVRPGAPRTRPGATRRSAALDCALEIARTIRSSYIEFMARLSQAQLSLDSGQEPHGLQALTAAMALGREHGYVNSHVWIPAVMARLCARALEAGIEVDYVRGLVEKRA